MQRVQGVDPLAERVAERWARKYTRPKNMVPVENKDTERIVYVLPETVLEEGGKYQKVPESKLDTSGKPAPLLHPGQPHLPQKPRKPHKPEIPRDPPPAPIHPPIPRKRVLPPKRPKPVKVVPPPKVPEPSKPKRWEKVKRFLQAYDHDPMISRVIERWLFA